MGTCLADMLYAEAGMAGIRLLEREGVKVIYPREQTCCGQPAVNSGFQEEALEVALHQIHCFPKAYPIVVPSGSCGAMMPGIILNSSKAIRLNRKRSSFPRESSN